MSVPGVGFRFKPKNKFYCSSTLDVVEGLGGGKRRVKKTGMEFLPPKVAPMAYPVQYLT